MKKLLANKNIFLITTLIIFFGWYLFHLTEIPIFADEAIYLNWAKRIAIGDENIFISMYDGKTPLFMWLSGLASYPIKNLLLAGRLVSVFSLFMASTYIFKKLKKTTFSWAFLSLVFILGNTFFFFHARLALLDTLFASLVILFIFTWSNASSIKQSLLSGLFISLAFLTKTPALFLLPLPFFVLTKKRDKATLVKVATTFSIFIATLLLLKTSPWFPSLFNRSTDFTFTITQVLTGQLNHVWPNIKIIFSWLSFYLTWPILLFSVLGSIKGFKNKNSLIINLSLASLLLFTPLAILGKMIASRYFLALGFTLPILAAYFLSSTPKKYIVVITAAFLSITIPNNYQFQDNYFYAILPKEDNQQYFRDWSSGIGLDSVSQFINQQAKDKKVLVLTEGTFGTLPDGLFVYQENKESFSNLEIVGVTSPYSEIYQQVLTSTNTKTIYYVGNHNRINDQFRQENKMILSYDKKDGGYALEVYEITQ